MLNVKNRREYVLSSGSSVLTHFHVTYLMTEENE